MRTPVGIAISLIVALAGIFAFSHRDTPSLGAHQIPVADMNLTSITQTDAGLLTAGELGHILISADQGATWAQAALSEQRYALVTGMHFKDGKTGIAIGHEGWILRTTDGGKSWQEVAFNAGGEPLLSVNQLPSGIWMAVGAFALTLISDDDGQNWSLVPAPNGTDWHLNGLLPSEDHRTWLIVGEAGTVMRSTDGGESWASIPEFYNGSFYGGLNFDQDNWIIYGMRGNIFHSEDNGATWTSVGGELPASMFTHCELANGDILLAGQGGIVLRSEDRGRSFHFVTKSGRMSITDIVLLGTDKLLMSSDSGLMPAVPALQLKQRSGA